MENHHVEWKNLGRSPFLREKLWKINMWNRETIEESTMFSGKNMEHHHIQWENYGKIHHV